MRKDESVSEYVQRLLAMINRRKRDEEIIREWKGLPKKEDPPAPKKSNKKFHSPEMEIIMEQQGGRKWNEQPKEPNPYDTFKKLEVERNQVVFGIKGVVPNIVLDFKTRSISIEIGNTFSLTTGNIKTSELKRLFNRLVKRYKPKKRKITFGIKKPVGRQKGYDPRKKRDLENAKKEGDKILKQVITEAKNERSG